MARDDDDPHATRAARPGQERPASPRLELFRAGEVLSETYEIRELLGAGGMGQVFEAHDRVLNRRVAIKAAHPHVPADLLRKEAQALAAIRHPCMITVHCVGSHRGVEYMVMERIYGVSLDAHIAKRAAARESFTVDETLDVLLALADGLAVVHRSGVAHRDVKPSNVMLAPGNRVVLMDFGLMLPEFEVAAQTTVAGSPYYIAPEAITTSVEPGAGHLVDLYALGVIAFQLLTGDVPFGGTDVAAICEAHVYTPAPDVATLRADVPPALAVLVTALLAKEPGARPQSADALVWQLRNVRARTAPASATGTTAGTAPSARFSVLVVDDDPDMLRVLSFYVKKAVPEAEVRTAPDGEKALEAVRADAPDVMLLDLQMPRMNGIEVCMYLRGTHFADRTTIVSVSAGAQGHDVQLLQQLGITHFVPKGGELGARLAAVLKGLRG